MTGATSALIDDELITPLSSSPKIKQLAGIVLNSPLPPPASGIVPRARRSHQQEHSPSNRTLEEQVEDRTRSLYEANQLLAQIARTDTLTGLPNRRDGMARINQAWADSIRDASPLACLMVDADGFQPINDRYGHDAGDHVLRELSRQLRYAMRTDDSVCRLGGDEFLVICPRTSQEGALVAAEALRQEIAKLHVPVVGAGEWPGSISVGVPVKSAGMQKPEDLIKAADGGLYIAKRNGRNRVECRDVLALANT